MDKSKNGKMLNFILYVVLIFFLLELLYVHCRIKYICETLSVQKMQRKTVILKFNRNINIESEF